MGYRDDFYSADNIIGFTGDLAQFPTIYFLTKGEFGHITQKHPTSQNVGRNAVEHAAGYFIGNETIDGSLRLVEKMNGAVFHKSRSTLTKVGPGDKDKLALCAQAIWDCPNEKYISRYSNKIHKTIDKAARNKAKVLDELTKG